MLAVGRKAHNIAYLNFVFTRYVIKLFIFSESYSPSTWRETRQRKYWRGSQEVFRFQHIHWHRGPVVLEKIKVYQFCISLSYHENWGWLYNPLTWGAW